MTKDTYLFNGILPIHYKKFEILPFVTIWMGLDGIMSSEISQRKTKYHIISLIYGI